MLRSPRRARVWASLTATLSLAIASCAPSADDPRSHTQSWEPASRAYRVHYLDPPWEVTAATDDTLFLRIRSTRMIAAGIDGGVGKFELFVSTVSGDPDALAAAEARQLQRDGYDVTAGPRSITNLDGVEGAELIGFLDAIVARWRRVAFYPLTASTSVRLAFEADPSLDSSEVEGMLLQVAIGPDE